MDVGFDQYMCGNAVCNLNETHSHNRKSNTQPYLDTVQEKQHIPLGDGGKTIPGHNRDTGKTNSHNSGTEKKSCNMMSILFFDLRDEQPCLKLTGEWPAGHD
jgi:hypothetical protein